MAAKFEVIRLVSGYRVDLRADDQVVLAGEIVRTRADAERVVASVRANARNEARFERRLSRSSQPFFFLKARNGQVLGISEIFPTLAARDTAIKIVQMNAATAALEEFDRVGGG